MLNCYYMVIDGDPEVLPKMPLINSKPHWYGRLWGIIPRGNTRKSALAGRHLQCCCSITPARVCRALTTTLGIYVTRMFDEKDKIEIINIDGYCFREAGINRAINSRRLIAPVLLKTCWMCPRIVQKEIPSSLTISRSLLPAMSI